MMSEKQVPPWAEPDERAFILSDEPLKYREDGTPIYPWDTWSKEVRDRRYARMRAHEGPAKYVELSEKDWNELDKKFYESSLKTAVREHPIQAIAGMVNGIKPADARRVYLENLAYSLKVKPEILERRVEAWVKRINSASEVFTGVKDLTSYLRESDAIEHSARWVAAAVCRCGVLMQDGRKFYLFGPINEGTMNYFIHDWGPKFGLSNFEGIPSQGSVSGELTDLGVQS